MVLTCDEPRCHARTVVTWWLLDNGKDAELGWCGHHSDKRRTLLLALGWQVEEDERGTWASSRVGASVPG